MIKPPSIPALLFLSAALPAAAELPMSAPLEGKPTPEITAPLPVGPPASRPVEAEAPAPGTDVRHAPQLSEAEQRIRQGIVMLGRLHDLLARVNDEPSAEAAVAPIMRSSAEFQSWAQGFSSLPPLDADTQRTYERRYLPIIDELNTRIRIQGERIASAEFYGSQNLPAALVRLVTSMQ